MSTIKSKNITKRRQSKTTKIFHGMAFTIMKHMFFIFRSYLEMVLDFIFSLYWDSQKQAIPHVENKLLTLSAVELADKIRRKELKSELLVQACIDRIKIVNPILNAVTDERFGDALREAKEIDKLIENGLTEEYFKKRPFLGVPFTAKESHAASGMRHTLGISLRQHLRAKRDAECVRLLKESGAVLLAVTNVPEINKWQETRNMVFGQTNNPYHTGRTVGGSSGGEAALAAALASPISLCSDIGGSIRMPAFYCGLFGLYPTAGYTSLEGSALRTGLDDTMASIGFVSKHCADLLPLTKVVAGDKAEFLDLDREVNIKDIKFFFVETAKDLRISPISKDLRKAMSSVIKHFKQRAESAEQVPQPYYHRGFDYMFSLWKHAMTKETECFAKMLMNNQGEVNGVLELTKKVVGMSPYTSAAILKVLDDQVMPKVNAQWADTLTQELKDDLLSTLGENGVLLFPSAPQVAPYHYTLLLRPFNFAYWGIFNVLRFPAGQVPLGLNSEGLPLGIQVVAGPRQEALCVAVAQYLEKEFGGFAPPCDLN